MTEESLFLAALDRTDPAERRKFLDDACARDSDLRKRIDVLLAAFAAGKDKLEPPAALLGDETQTIARGSQTADFHTGAEAGMVIAGRYKLVEPIGEGGMGSVWLAQQSEPVKRKVAVKLIKAGMDSKQVLTRFEAERQALAMMDHPNIAKVLDGGIVDAQAHGRPSVGLGRPFFVMELVKGVPITEYCDKYKLTPKQRLELFVPVCQAIQHAHQKGIIHRDIKPSNVLIALYDDKPVPKVIDFGVAKATGQQLSEQTINTGFGGVVGTPQYMSPEQATFNNLDIDTRSDVYSLGVLLYELLTGTPPFSQKELEKKGLLEVLRVVREVEPPKPSTKLSTADAVASLSANRGTEPRKLTALLRNELDWIVLKALEKDRARRYETANGFAADINRYLAGEPVVAHPPSAGYRIKKFVRRNQPQVLAASLVLLALMTGIAGTTFGLIRANRFAEAERLAKLDADTKRVEAEQARAAEAERAEGERLAKLEAVAQTEQARKRLTQIEKANDILGSIFENLDPKEIARAERPLQAILVEKLDQAVAQLEGESIGDPLVVAAMQAKFGYSLLGLGEPGKAIVLLEKARATRQAKLGPEHPDTLNSMNNLAGAYREAGKLDLALPLFEETLKLRKETAGPDHPDTLTSMNNLADCYNLIGQPDKARSLYEETLARQKATLGLDNSSTLITMANLAKNYLTAGKLDKALPLFDTVLARFKAVSGPDHPDTLISMGDLAMGYQALGQFDKALPLFEESLRIMKIKLGPDHLITLAGMDKLATGYYHAVQLDKALPLFEETLTRATAKLGPDHHFTLQCMSNLATCYDSAGKLDKALPLLEETLTHTEAKLGPNHPATLTVMNNLASAYYAANKLELALPLYEETLARRTAKLGRDHPGTLNSMRNLASAYDSAKQFHKAELLYRENLLLVKQKSGSASHDYATALALLSLNLLNQTKWTEAEPLLRECLAIREKTQPDVWSTYNIKSMLGGALLGQKKYADAEPLLLKGYEGMKQREKTMPSNSKFNIPNSLDRLIQLYTETNKPDEVKKWQAERAKYSTPKEHAPPPREVK